MKYLTAAAQADYAFTQRSMEAITAKYPFACKVPLGRTACGREINTLVLCCPGKRQSGRVLVTAAETDRTGFLPLFYCVFVKKSVFVCKTVCQWWG